MLSQLEHQLHALLLGLSVVHGDTIVEVARVDNEIDRWMLVAHREEQLHGMLGWLCKIATITGANVSIAAGGDKHQQ